MSGEPGGRIGPRIAQSPEPPTRQKPLCALGFSDGAELVFEPRASSLRLGVLFVMPASRVPSDVWLGCLGYSTPPGQTPANTDRDLAYTASGQLKFEWGNVIAVHFGRVSRS